MSLDFFAVNIWAVLVSGFAYFAIGAFWYGLFATPWMAGIGKSQEDLQSSPIDYVVSLLCEILIAYGVAIGLNVFGVSSLPDAIFVVTVLWFAFALLPTIVHYAYEDRTLGLLAINKGYDYIGMIVASVILYYWK